MSDKLPQAITLIKSGEKQKGGQILANLLKVDPQNELAWLWMSKVVDTKKRQQYCLRQVLTINPGNEIARKALDKIDPTPKSSVEKIPQVRPPSTPSMTASPIPATPVSATPMSATKRNWILIIAVGWMLALMVMVLGGYLLMQEEKPHDDFAPLVEVCQGKRIKAAATYSRTPGKHPAVGVKQGPDGLQLDMSFIPGEAQAQLLAETQLVLCMGKVEDVLIESCPYTDLGNPYGPVTNYVERYYYKQDAKLVVAKTGRVISVETFTGKSARHCQDIEQFRPDEKVIRLKGTDISIDKVRSWLRPQLIIE